MALPIIEPINIDDLLDEQDNYDKKILINIDETTQMLVDISSIDTSQYSFFREEPKPTITPTTTPNIKPTHYDINEHDIVGFGKLNIYYPERQKRYQKHDKRHTETHQHFDVPSNCLCLQHFQLDSEKQ